jgi:hypothetical protein
MANPLLLDIALFIVAQGLATGDGVDIFRDFTPEEPDSLIALHEYAGDPASPYETAVHRSVQISARSTDADAARQKALSVFSAMQENRGTDCRLDLTTERFGQVYLRQPPFFYKRDENDRTYYAFNIGITTTIE